MAISAQAMQSTATPTPQAQSATDARAAYIARLARAMDRAKAEKLIAFPNADGTWSCKTYTLTITGPKVTQVACNCIAGQSGQVCKHSICVMMARKYHVRPIRPTQAVEVAPATSVAPMTTVAASTPAEIAETAALMAEVTRELAGIAATETCAHGVPTDAYCRQCVPEKLADAQMTHRALCAAQADARRDAIVSDARARHAARDAHADPFADFL